MNRNPLMTPERKAARDLIVESRANARLATEVVKGLPPKVFTRWELEMLAAVAIRNTDEVTIPETFAPAALEELEVRRMLAGLSSPEGYTPEQPATDYTQGRTDGAVAVAARPDTRCGEVLAQGWYPNKKGQPVHIRKPSRCIRPGGHTGKHVASGISWESKPM